jgi:hypothetical protein
MNAALNRVVNAFSSIMEHPWQVLMIFGDTGAVGGAADFVNKIANVQVQIYESLHIRSSTLTPFILIYYFTK